jgi:hypothetical protein
MCCTTHHDRDLYDNSLGVEFTIATGDHFRCRCEFKGNSCDREQSGPDLLCDWCRQYFGQEAHIEYCYDDLMRPPRSMLRSGAIPRRLYEDGYAAFDKIRRNYGS